MEPDRCLVATVSGVFFGNAYNVRRSIYLHNVCLLDVALSDYRSGLT